MKEGLPFTILSVDDDADDREIIDEAFKEIGYEDEIKKFIEGKALLKYLEQIDPSMYPSLIVLDNTLHGIDVPQIIHYLKNNEAYKHIPIVIYSGTITPSKKDELLRMGVYKVLEKGRSMKAVTDVAKELKRLAEASKNKTLKRNQQP